MDPRVKRAAAVGGVAALAAVVFPWLVRCGGVCGAPRGSRRLAAPTNPHHPDPRCRILPPFVPTVPPRFVLTVAHRDPRVRLAGIAAFRSASDALALALCHDDGAESGSSLSFYRNTPEEALRDLGRARFPAGVDLRLLDRRTGKILRRTRDGSWRLWARA